MTDKPAWVDALAPKAEGASFRDRYECQWPAITMKPGDLATLAQPSGKHSQGYAGITVCISETAITENDPRLLERGLVAPAARDYLIRYPDGSLGLVDAWQLEPINPEPAP